MSISSTWRRKLDKDAVTRAKLKDPYEGEFFKRERFRMWLRQWVRDNPASGLVAQDEDKI